MSIPWKGESSESSSFFSPENQTDDHALWRLACNPVGPHRPIIGHCLANWDPELPAESRDKWRRGSMPIRILRPELRAETFPRHSGGLPSSRHNTNKTNKGVCSTLQAYSSWAGLRRFRVGSGAGSRRHPPHRFDQRPRRLRVFEMPTAQAANARAGQQP